jgi:hypothetical protein
LNFRFYFCGHGSLLVSETSHSIEDVFCVGQVEFLGGILSWFEYF